MLVNDVLGFFYCLDASVDGEFQVGEVVLQLVDSIIPQWRHISVLSGTQPFEKSLPGMDDEVVDVVLTRNLGHKIPGKLIGVELIHSQPAFDCARSPFDSLPHGPETVVDESRLSHQACPEGARLDPGTGTANIKVDFVVAIVDCHLSCFCQFFGVTASKLQDNRMLLGVKWEYFVVHALDGIVVDHFRVDGGFLGQQPDEASEMSIRDILEYG